MSFPGGVAKVIQNTCLETCLVFSPREVCLLCIWEKIMFFWDVKHSFKFCLHLIVTYLNLIVHKLRDENVTCKKSMLETSVNAFRITKYLALLNWIYDIPMRNLPWSDTFIMVYPVFHVYSTLIEYRVYQKHIELPYSSLISDVDWISRHCHNSPVYRWVTIVNATHKISTNLKTNVIFFFRYILGWLFMKYHTENL